MREIIRTFVKSETRNELKMLRNQVKELEVRVKKVEKDRAISPPPETGP